MTLTRHLGAGEGAEAQQAEDDHNALPVSTPGQQRHPNLLPGKYYDLMGEHAKLLKFIHSNPHSGLRIMGACVEYLKHGTPEMIRIADAVDFAVKREITLIEEQIKKGVPV
jgi:hypothetical protein